ncbi:hypothetical protein N9P17_04810 [Tateyamaria sp.]|nr:hypothetical protein [Tateyamaria sp.]
MRHELPSFYFTTSILLRFSEIAMAAMSLNRYVKFVLHALAAGKWCHRIKLGAALPQKNQSFMQALIQP